jgi:cephalosporin hydroxylase
MKFEVDTTNKTIRVHDAPQPRTIDLFGSEAFDLLSEAWVKVGWALRYSYGFSWMGRPIIQLPEDAFRMQEILYQVKPDVIVETGVAHGGSLIYYASLCKAMGSGRVVGVDLEIRPHNRAAIEAHELAPLIRLIEGDSVAPSIVSQVRALLKRGERVLVILDSNHSKSHVAAELEAYGPFVTKGSYMVATDGIMKDLSDVPGGQPGWTDDNPVSATREFLSRHPEFKLEPPVPPFDERMAKPTITYWPSAWLRRIG